MIRRLLLLFALVSVGCASTTALGGTISADEPSRASDRAVLAQARISFTYASNWHVRTTRLNGVLGPTTRFTVTSFPLRQPRPDAAFCASTLNDQWPPTGAWVQLTEELDGASLKKLLRRIPPRPQRFRLAKSGAGGLCTGPVSGQLAFQERGRAFYLDYGVGASASPGTRRALLALIDSVRIGE